MDNWVFKHAAQLSAGTFRKLSGAHPIDLSYDDIKAELLLWYCERKSKVIEDWDGKPDSWKSYISFMLANRARTRMAKAFDNRAKTASICMFDMDTVVGRMHLEEGVMEPIVIENRDPEVLLIEDEEERNVAKRVAVIVDEIKQYCEDFKLEYNTEEPLECLLRVLDYTLNQMNREDFLNGEIPALVQRRLTRLAEAVNEGGLDIRLVNGKVRTSGILGRIRGYMDEGDDTPEKVIARLDADNIIYNRNSTYVMIGNVRKERGLLPIKGNREGVSTIVRREFDQGRGITAVQEMQNRLKELGIHFIPSSVKFCLTKLCKQYGIKRG